MKNELENILQKSTDRIDFWIHFINKNQCADLAEVGVYRGEFAEAVLRACPEIQRYKMIDPWRNLTDWNKPANKDDLTFEEFYQETMGKTDFAKEKRIVLRGKTTEIIHEIEDNSLDYIYIDGDHTLKGISIDLINFWNKVKPGGFIGGDDFVPLHWNQNNEFEPTLIFPFAVYFAEARNTKIFALPFRQFLILKEANGFEFIDLTEKEIYRNKALNTLFSQKKKKENKWLAFLVQSFPSLYAVYKKLLPKTKEAHL